MAYRDNDTLRQEMAQAMAPEQEEAAVLDHCLSSAGDLILNQMYPFGYEEGAQVPARYQRLQVRIAVELWAKRGAEGETSHTENGTQRVYEAADVSPSLLRQILPFCGGVGS